MNERRNKWMASRRFEGIYMIFLSKSHWLLLLTTVLIVVYMGARVFYHVQSKNGDVYPIVQAFEEVIIA